MARQAASTILGRFPQVAAPREQASGDAGGRDEIGRELDRIESALRRRFGLAGLAGLRCGGEKDRALATGEPLLDETEGGTALHRLDGAAPIAIGALRLQHGLVGPGDAGSEARGLGRIGTGGHVVLAAAGFHEQPAQAEHPRLGIVDHALERVFRRLAVTGDLRGLRLQEERQRLGTEQTLGVAGMATRRQGIARADRDHAPREGGETLGPATLLGATDQGLGKRDDSPHHGPDEPDDDGGDEHPDQGDGEARGDLVPVPHDGDRAGPVGDPCRPEGGNGEEG